MDRKSSKEASQSCKNKWIPPIGRLKERGAKTTQNSELLAGTHQEYDVVSLEKETGWSGRKRAFCSERSTRSHSGISAATNNPKKRLRKSKTRTVEISQHINLQNVISDTSSDAKLPFPSSSQWSNIGAQPSLSSGLRKPVERKEIDEPFRTQSDSDLEVDIIGVDEDEIPLFQSTPSTNDKSINRKLGCEISTDSIVPSPRSMDVHQLTPELSLHESSKDQIVTQLKCNETEQSNNLTTKRQQESTLNLDEDLNRKLGKSTISSSAQEQDAPLEDSSTPSGDACIIKKSQDESTSNDETRKYYQLSNDSRVSSRSFAKGLDEDQGETTNDSFMSCVFYSQSLALHPSGEKSTKEEFRDSEQEITDQNPVNSLVKSSLPLPLIQTSTEVSKLQIETPCFNIIGTDRQSQEQSLLDVQNTNKLHAAPGNGEVSVQAFQNELHNLSSVMENSEDSTAIFYNQHKNASSITLEVLNRSNLQPQSGYEAMGPETNTSENFFGDLSLSSSQFLALDAKCEQFKRDQPQLREPNSSLPRHKPKPFPTSQLGFRVPNSPDLNWTQAISESRQRLKTVTQEISRLNAMVLRARRTLWPQRQATAAQDQRHLEPILVPPTQLQQGSNRVVNGNWKTYPDWNYS